ncbi:ArsR/SmtB family transcription factor [Staphylospora marina]|uniref:ArsR/SmtB family transcription factor n=1 Tax=Staphylospora marina TaxID=2490858 RepID=UPI000F5B8DF0|nr:metalloregulator ArsR/SmtB family transcription factor [Staphylospora marina]
MAASEKFARVARALGDPIRLNILDLLMVGYEKLEPTPPPECCNEGVCVCDLQTALGMAQSKVSYHLKELKNADLVTETRVGRWHFYSLNKETLRHFHSELSRRFLS